jgi:membrane protein involved in colicin uptake
MTSPDSVLCSLRRLRQIEEERLQREEDEARARAAERQRAEENARAAAQRAEEQARREAAEAAEATRVREAERAREERLRLAEAATRARIEAELQLERERVAREHEARRVDRRSALARALPVALCCLLLLASGLSFVAWRREAATASALAERLERARRRDAEARGRARGLEETLASRTDRVEQLRRELATCRATPSPPVPAAQPNRPSGARPASKPPRPPTIDTSCAKDPIGCIAPGR